MKITFEQLLSAQSVRLKTPAGVRVTAHLKDSGGVYGLRVVPDGANDSLNPFSKSRMVTKAFVEDWLEKLETEDGE